MTTISEVQKNQVVEIKAVITNFNDEIGEDDQLSSTFDIGGIPARCSGESNVVNAMTGAEKANARLLIGEFRTSGGRTEFLAHEVKAAPPIPADYGTPRTTSSTVEEIEGRLSDLRKVSTGPGRRHMITFRIGTKSCKAFGEVADFLENQAGESICISARKGSYCGKTEYAVITMKSLNGISLTIKDDVGKLSHELTK